jgi:hypothetical protein
VRLTANLLNPINVIWAVQSHSQKYFCFSELQIKLYDSPSHPTEGRIMIVAYAGWDAMDAGGAKDESAGMRTAKSCGPDASTPASSLGEATPQDDGDKKARSPGRARRKPLKPLRGNAGCSGATVVTNARAFYTTRAAAGATGTRHSPLPRWGESFTHSPGASRRGNADAHLFPAVQIIFSWLSKY